MGDQKVSAEKDIFRTKYEKLTGEQQNTMTSIKNRATSLMQEFAKAVPRGDRSYRSRYMNLARTALEMAIMWAVKGVTLPEEKEE